MLPQPKYWNSNHLPLPLWSQSLILLSSSRPISANKVPTGKHAFVPLAPVAFFISNIISFSFHDCQWLRINKLQDNVIFTFLRRVHYVNSAAIEGDDGSFVRVTKNGASNFKIEASKAKILFRRF